MGGVRRDKVLKSPSHDACLPGVSYETICTTRLDLEVSWSDGLGHSSLREIDDAFLRRVEYAPRCVGGRRVGCWMERIAGTDGVRECSRREGVFVRLC